MTEVLICPDCNTVLHTWQGEYMPTMLRGCNQCSRWAMEPTLSDFVPEHALIINKPNKIESS